MALSSTFPNCSLTGALPSCLAGASRPSPALGPLPQKYYNSQNVVLSRSMQVNKTIETWATAATSHESNHTGLSMRTNISSDSSWKPPPMRLCTAHVLDSQLHGLWFYLDNTEAQLAAHCGLKRYSCIPLHRHPRVLALHPYHPQNLMWTVYTPWQPSLASSWLYSLGPNNHDALENAKIKGRL